MPAAQLYSGVGSPEGGVFGNPGDLYQDETGKVWAKGSGAGTNTGWQQLSTGAGSSVFVAGAGAGSAIQNNGTGNAATGANSTVCGENNRLTGEASFAEGVNNVETIVMTGINGASNHLEGKGNSIANTLSDAGGFNHVEGNANTLTDSAAGHPCDFNHVEGSTNTLTASGGPIEFNHVEGDQNALTITSGSELDFNHIEGANNALLVNGGDISFSHVEGTRNTLTSTASDADNTHVEGNRNAVTDADTSHIEGNQNTVSAGGGTANHVEGNRNSLTGNANTANFVHLEGTNCVAQHNTVHVQGDHAKATRETQFARASGPFVAAGDAQTSVLVMRGSTPGAAPNESVELTYGTFPGSGKLTLEDGKAYVIRVRAIGYATDTNFMSFENTFAANQEGGVITIKPAPPHAIPPVAGTAGASSWTLTANTAAAPTRISFTFATGVGTTAAVRIAADIEFIEVARA